MLPAMSDHVTARELIKKASVNVAAGTFSLVRLEQAAFARLLAASELSPRLDAPFMIFSDGREVTLLLDQQDLQHMRPGLGDAKLENDFRLLSFDIEMDFTVVGFIAEISAIMASANIPIVALSSFSTDHLLVKQTDLANALKALGPYVAEAC